MNESDGLLLLGRSVVFRPLLVAVAGRANRAGQDGMEEMRDFEWTTITPLRHWLSTHEHIKTNSPIV